MLNNQITAYRNAFVELVQARRSLRDRRDYLTNDCWTELKEKIDSHKKELLRTQNLIDANDIQLEELIDALNEELDIEEGNMYM